MRGPSPRWLLPRFYGERQGEIGGERGIRTHGRVSPTHAFQACSFNHSDISPSLESTIYERPIEIIAHAVHFRAVRSISFALSGLMRHENGRSGELCKTSESPRSTCGH